MPSVLLSAPHFEQSADGACLPTCTRMVLAYYGDLRTEATLSVLLGTKPYGTPISNVSRLAAWGYRADLVTLTRAELEAWLDQGVPIIVRVWTGMLDYWSVETSHVVVVIGYDDDGVILNDPGVTGPARLVLWDAFLAAWAEFDETAVVIPANQR